LPNASNRPRDREDHETVVVHVLPRFLRSHYFLLRFVLEGTHIDMLEADLAAYGDWWLAGGRKRRVSSTRASNSDTFAERNRICRGELSLIEWSQLDMAACSVHLPLRHPKSGKACHWSVKRRRLSLVTQTSGHSHGMEGGQVHLAQFNELLLPRRRVTGLRT